MKVVAIIQARMGSTRLPGKVLKDIAGATMLARVVQRTQQATTLKQIIVATTTFALDDEIVTACEQLNIPVFRGEEHDVLDRYYQAAQAYQAEAIVRITSDCPLIDPEVIDRVVNAFLYFQPDYVSNSLERTYPRGLDTEIMTMAGLERAWREATVSYQRIHVTPYFYQNPHLFRLFSVKNDSDYSEYRWTVDTLDDLAFVQAVYARLGNNDKASWRVILALLQNEPTLAEINCRTQQKALHEG